jgi:uroporphyrinogen-III synthase
MKPIFLNAKSTSAGASLHECAAAHGFALIDCPLFTTQLAPVDAALRAQLLRVQSAQWCIFVSPIAVRSAFALLPELAGFAARFAAVGPATAVVLPRYDVLKPVIGEGAQALLNCAELENVRGQIMAIFAPPDGLSLLSDGLRARGADAMVLPVYRRVSAVLSDTQRWQCLAATHCYVGSGAFLAALIAERAGVPLTVFAPSARVAEQARSLGCIAYVCADASEHALCLRLAQYFLPKQNRDALF